ncbi:DYW family of nucleic acid deaminases-domain-containing protein [Xylariaceae sp. FL1272]|nr:DYW family of nucleic acid deaminases-domain-containing protein [Xylariaceae sp. FL1272]
MLAPAPVEWWDGDSMYIRCPWCQRIHRHGFLGDYTHKYYRVPHCGSRKYGGDRYECQFPKQYEIDRKRALYVAPGKSPSEYPEQSNDTHVRPSIDHENIIQQSDRGKEATQPVYVDGDDGSINGTGNTLLEDNTRRTEISRALVLKHFTYTKTAGLTTQMSLYALFAVPDEYKTIAVLHRGGDLAPITAMSGWRHGSEGQFNVLLGGRDWTDKVLRLCQVVGHNLRSHAYDQGQHGRFSACHAEKQLVAYLIYKHCFLPRENEQSSQINGSIHNLGTLIAGINLTRVETDDSHADKLDDLRSCEPPFRLNQATIMVSEPVCDDCKAFIRLVNACFSLHITVQFCTVIEMS